VHNSTDNSRHPSDNRSHMSASPEFTRLSETTYVDVPRLPDATRAAIAREVTMLALAIYDRDEVLDEDDHQPTIIAAAAIYAAIIAREP